LALTQPQPINYELHDPDVRLMLQVKGGDAAAFTELVLPLSNRLLTILERGKQSRAGGGFGSGNVPAGLSGPRTLSQAVQHVVIHDANNVASNARSRSRRREVGVPEGNGADSAPLGLDQLAKAASGFMPTRALDKAEQAEMVRHAVAALSERQRMALLLAKFEGMSYQDIASSMDLSVQAIKSLLSRARVNLKEILTPYVEQGVRLEETEAPAAVNDETAE
jgi:RNA polymerase sigma-70 factor (ECF subfamily)